MGFKKSDVEFHGHTPSGRPRPAVCVKVHGCLGDVVPNVDFPDLTRDWLEEHESEWIEWAFSSACEDAWEILQSEAEAIYSDRKVKVYAAGHSGGWAYIEGIWDDVASWDAIALGRWARFSAAAAALTEDVPYRMADMIYHNIFLPSQEAELAAATEGAARIVTRAGAPV